MTIEALRLRDTENPGKTALYEVRKSREIIVEEKQNDGSLDQVILEYCIEDENMIGYFAKEYRPAGVEKSGAKKIDITALVVDHSSACVRWHLYDVKDTLAGGYTIVKLYDQWNAGLDYLHKNVLSHVERYTLEPHLGVITRKYEKERMERLRDEYQKRCDKRNRSQDGMSLSMQKAGMNLPMEKAVLKAATAILNKEFQSEDRSDTYEILLKYLDTEDDRTYKVRIQI